MGSNQVIPGLRRPTSQHLPPHGSSIDKLVFHISHSVYRLGSLEPQLGGMHYGKAVLVFLLASSRTVTRDEVLCMLLARACISSRPMMPPFHDASHSHFSAATARSTKTSSDLLRQYFIQAGPSTSAWSANNVDSLELAALGRQAVAGVGQAQRSAFCGRS